MEGLQNVIVQQDDTESHRSDSPTSSDWTVRPVQFPPSSMATGRGGISTWKKVVTGTVLSVTGVAGGTYALRNFENPSGWAIMGFTAGAAGALIVARSFTDLFACNLFNTQTNTDLEAQHILALIDQSLASRRNFNQPPFNFQPGADASFPPSPTVSQPSSEVFGPIERADYRPNTSELAFRQKQTERAKKYKKFTDRQWSSAPMVLRKDRQAKTGQTDRPGRLVQAMLQQRASGGGLVPALIQGVGGSGRKLSLDSSVQRITDGEEVNLAPDLFRKSVDCGPEPSPCPDVPQGINSSGQGIDLVPTGSQEIEGSGEDLVPAVSLQMESSENEPSLDSHVSQEVESSGQEPSIGSDVSQEVESSGQEPSIGSDVSQEVESSGHEPSLGSDVSQEDESSGHGRPSLGSDVSQAVESSGHGPSLGSDVSQEVESSGLGPSISLDVSDESVSSGERLSSAPGDSQKSEGSGQEPNADPAASQESVGQEFSSPVESEMSEESWHDFDTESQESLSSGQEYSSATGSAMVAEGQKLGTAVSPVNGGHQEATLAPVDPEKEELESKEGNPVGDEEDNRS